MFKKILSIKKYFRTVYIFTVILFASSFLYITNKIYEITLDDTKRNHQQQQYQMVKAVAQGVDFFLEHIINELNQNSLNVTIDEGDNYAKKNKKLKSIYSNTDKKYITNIILISRGYPSKITSLKKIYYSLSETINFKILDSVVKKNDFYISDVFLANTEINKNENAFLIVFPLHEKRNENSLNKFLAYEISFNSMINRFVKNLNLSNNDYIWIIDGKGRLIYHPKHEEMLFNSVYNEDKDCFECHTSFSAQKKMLQQKGAAFDEYSSIKGSKKRIYAFIPITFGNLKWYLSVSTILEDVTKQLTGRFLLFFLLGIVIFSSIVFFMVIIYYLNIQKMKVEESNKSLKKIQEYQEQLNHSSRLASIGELVDAVAHEINTPIGIISAHLDSINLLKDKIDLNSELELIKRQTKRMADYVGSLLYFSKRMSTNLEEIDVRKIAEECIFILNHRLKEKRIKVAKLFERNPVKLIGDKRQLEQVFINLLINSIDAVNQSGEITISIHNHFIKSEDEKVRRFVNIEIIDNGVGIKEEDKQKIFEAFFTTKEKNGTGLGLSIIKTIIQKLNGTINVDSQIGKGSKFTILIPGDLNYDK